MKTKLAVLLTALIALSGCSTSRVKKAKGVPGEVVVAEGMAPYQADDLPGSRAAALAAAQRAAVELVVGVYVNAKTRVDKAVAIENNILTKTSGYVKRYEVMSEGRDGEWYKMKIRALVLTQTLREDLDHLGALQKPAVGNPRVAILLQEYIGQNQAEDRPATRVITDGLLKRGFKVVELPKSINREDDAGEIAQNMSRKNAEILIAGLARAQSLGYGEKALGGMSSYRASVNFRVIEVGTAEVIKTVAQTASGVEAHKDLAGAKALEKAAELTIPELQSLPQELLSRAHAEVTIKGLTSFETLGKFEKDLATQPGVKDVTLRSFSQEDGIVVLDVQIDQISPQELADTCVRVGGPVWSVFQVAGRTISLSASQAGR